MVEEKFKLPDSSYEELVKIIKAYGHTEKPISLEEVTRVSGVPRTIVSGNNGFLLSVGIIEGGKAKGPTRLGTTLARALEHEMPEEIQSVWREVVNGNDFLTKMLAAIKIRKGMDIATLQGHIAYSAGERKTSRTATGAKAVVDVLHAAGLVQEEDGRVVATQQPEPPPPVREEEPTKPTDIFGLFERPQPRPAGQGISLHIQVQVQAKPSELEGLGRKLRQVIEEFSTKLQDKPPPTPES